MRIEATGRLADLARPNARGALAQALRDDVFPSGSRRRAEWRA